MKWTAIIGQALAVRLLRQATLAGKVAHAYLFVGPEGVGKRTAAMALASALNCHAPNDGSSCGHCPACHKLSCTPPVHPDVAIVEPDGRFIKTDQMRELQADMYARPNEGRFRIAIIDGADRMNAEAGNRMLKLLEEPPAHAVFIMVTQNLSAVLPTIISRCQVVNFAPLAVEDVAFLLRERFHLDTGRANLYAALSGGSLGRAVSMAQDPAVAERRDECYQFLTKIRELDDAGLLAKAEALDKQKEQVEDWLEMTLTWLRDALIFSQTGLDRLVINADRLADVRALAQAYATDALLDMLGAVTETRGRLQRNANARLALDVLMLRFHAAR